MTTPTIELVRDADGHVALDHAQAAAVARWYLADDDDASVPSPHFIAEYGLDACEELARYVLRVAAERERVAGVVAAAVEYVETIENRDFPGFRRPARQHLVAAVRAAGLAERA